jgi:CBS domain-containing protein
MPSPSKNLPLVGDHLPLVGDLMRPIIGVSPNLRVGPALEILRTAPHHCVAVVSANQQLLGLLTDSTIAATLLTAENREAVLQQTVDSVMAEPTESVFPDTPISALLQTLDAASTDTLPVIGHAGQFYGLIGRADLVRELIRPLALPSIGGMATPVGVYLTTGAVSGGVSSMALILTGLLFFFAQAVLLLLLSALPKIISGPLAASFELLLASIFPMAGFLGLIRLSPLAGYHAAEHQVVHALEQSEPLLLDFVKKMPRVHPRCGTNFAAAAFGFTLSFLLALAYWRHFGGWIQEHLSTKPATEKQLASGIAAAKELLEQHNRRPYLAPGPLSRLWRSGLPQILLGFAIGVGILVLLGWLVPSFGRFVRPILSELI